MEYKIVDGYLFKKMIINGTLYLKNNHQKINNLNVFPVPDGDTGTNMQFTMMEGVRQLNLVDDVSIIEVSKILSDALLIGSKGNSGIILSQFFAGIYDKINTFQKKQINIEEFIASLINGYQKSYNAVMYPVEGTILTVLRESIEGIKQEQKSFSTVKEVLEKFIKYAEISLKKTPSLLPVLKQSNVVDSGGAGFIFLLEGMLLYLNDIVLKENEHTNLNKQFFNAELDDYSNVEQKNIKYIYCTEFIIILDLDKNLNLDQLKELFLQRGDSIVLIQNFGLLKIHIHTNEPGYILTELLKYGTIKKSKIDNMKEQNKFYVHNQISTKEVFSKKYFIIATNVLGEEIQNTFKDLKVDFILDYVPKKNILDDFKKIIESSYTENVIIFPNDQQVALVALKVAKLYPNINIEVLETKNIAEVYSALLVFDEKISLQSNLKNMRKNIKKNKIGKITYACHSESQKFSIFKNVFLGIFRGKIITDNEDIVFVIKNLLKKMITAKNKFLTIFYYNKTLFKEKLDEIEIFLEINYPYLEIEKIENNNDISPYIFALE